MEFPGILRHTTGVAPAKFGIDWSRSARLGNHELLLAANGAGAGRAAAAVDAALQSFRAEAIVSTGFCGALARPGDRRCVVGTAVSAGSRTFPALHPPVSGAHHRGSGLFASITSPRPRRRSAGCAPGGGSAVEMEAGGVAERARARDVPFYCVRVVTDLADEDMANDFNRHCVRTATSLQ